MGFGLILGSGAARRGGAVTISLTAKQVKYLRRTYSVLFALVIIGYVIWIGSAILAGVRFVDLSSVINRQIGAVGELKSNSRPIGGLTTLTQFAPVAVGIGVILYKLGYSVKWVYLLIALACIRTIFYAERLALIEVLVPALIIISLTVPDGSRWRHIARSAPLIAAPSIWAVFAISEYLRSWVYYQQTTNLHFAEWVTTRLAGYYVTSYNNSALFVQAQDGTGAAPYFTFDAIWNAPGVPATAHGGIAGTSAPEWWSNTLATRSNPEFTSIGSFLLTYGELGLFGMVTFWLATGLIVGVIFAQLSRGSIPGLIAYASLLVGILELPRFIYWTQGRAVPVILALAVIASLYPRTNPKTTLRAAKKRSAAVADQVRAHGVDDTTYLASRVSKQYSPELQERNSATEKSLPHG